MANIIFDFDGTIANTFDYFAHFLAREAKQAPLTEERLLALKGLSLMTTARRLGHAWWRMPGLYYAGRLWLSDVIDELQPFDDMVDVIKALHADGHRLYIVSSNSDENIEAFLKKWRIKAEFTHVYGNIFWRSKSYVLRRLVRHSRLKRADTVYIGDELRDIRAARRAGLKVVAVTWGYNTRAALAADKPNFLVSKPTELLDVFA